MLTAVIRASSSAGPLAATLSGLIPAVAGGLLGHAVVLAPEADPEIERIADATGADIVAGGDAGWSAGAAQARTDWLILLEAGDLPQNGWIRAVESHLLAAPGRPVLLAMSGLAGLAERAAIALGSRGLRPGLVAARGSILAGRLGKAPRLLPCGRDRAEA